MRARCLVLALCVVITTGVSNSAVAGEALQWRIEGGGNGHWYQRFDAAVEVNWIESRNAAVSGGGYLVTLTSPAEQTWVTAHFVTGLPTCSPASWATPRSAWIGLFQDRQSPSYSEPAGGWRWVTEEPFQFNAWSAAEPNNVDYPADFVGMYWNGQWDDTPVDAGIYCHKAYIVEWSADCNSDGIVDFGQIRDGTLADANTNNIPDCCEGSGDCPLLPTQWRVEDGGNGHWYLGVIAEGCTWTGARAAALARGADLVSLGSQTESDWVFVRIAARASLWHNRVGPRIGLMQDPKSVEPAGGWHWSDGTPLAYANWNVDGFYGAPNPIEIRPCNDSDYGGYYGWPSSPMNSWGSYQDNYVSSCHWESFPSYIIEWSSDCNNDGLVDFGQFLDGTLVDANQNGTPDSCECAGDLNNDGAVGSSDLSLLLTSWGGATPLIADINGDGEVNAADMALLLAHWGVCTQ